MQTKSTRTVLGGRRFDLKGSWTYSIIRITLRLKFRTLTFMPPLVFYTVDMNLYYCDWREWEIILNFQHYKSRVIIKIWCVFKDKPWDIVYSNTYLKLCSNYRSSASLKVPNSKLFLHQQKDAYDINRTTALELKIYALFHKQEYCGHFTWRCYK